MILIIVMLFDIHHTYNIAIDIRGLRIMNINWMVHSPNGGCSTSMLVYARLLRTAGFSRLDERVRQPDTLTRCALRHGGLGDVMILI